MKNKTLVYFTDHNKVRFDIIKLMLQIIASLSVCH